MAFNIGDSNYSRIINETELQKTITDERLRAEQHKLNYQTLKHDYIRLQQDYASVQNEMSKTYEEMRLIREKDKQLLEEARQEIIRKVNEIESIKQQTMDSEKIKLLEMKLKTDLEKTFKEKLNEIEVECDTLRMECNKLKVENVFLKSEYDNDHKQHINIVDNLKLQYESQLSGIKKEKEVRLNEQQMNSMQDFRHLKQLQFENSKLLAKNKSLSDELEELRNRKDTTKFQTDSMNRTNSKVLSEYQSTIKTYESERQLFKQQLENSHKDLKLLVEEKNDLSSVKLELEKQNSMLRNTVEVLEHKLKMDMAQMKIDMLRDRGVVEQEKSKFIGLYQDACTEVEALREALNDLNTSAVEKDRDVMKKMQMMKEDHWKINNDLLNDKMILETELKKLKQERMTEVEERSQMFQKMEMRLQELEDERDCLKKEVQSLKNKLSNQQPMLDQLEKMTMENSNLKTRLSRLDDQCHIFIGNEKNALDKNEKLTKQVNDLEKQLQTLQMDSLKNRDVLDKEVSEKISACMEDKCRLQAKCDEVEMMLDIAQRKLTNNAQSYKQKKALLKRLVIRHKEKINNLNNKLLNMDSQHHYSSNNHINATSNEDIMALKRKLRDILQRNDEFKHLLMSTRLKSEYIDGLPFATIDKKDYMPYSNGELDWSTVKKRVQEIGDMQNEHLVKLKVDTTPKSNLTTTMTTMKKVEKITNAREGGHDDVNFNNEQKYITNEVKNFPVNINDTGND